jgi:hypothetical protein
MSWICVPDTEGFLLPSDSSEIPSELSVTLNGKHTVRPSSWPGWRRRPWIRLRYGTMLQPSTADAGVERWISSLPDSRVPPSVSRERGGGAEDPRYIWPSILRIIRETESRLVFLENVPGLLHTGFGEILKDLATAGYDAEWGVFSAQEVGAPHRRNRVFVLAYPHGQQLEILEGIPLYNEKECQTVARSMGISLWAASPSDFFGDADGSPARLDRLRILGNGIVPLQAAHAFRVLLQRLKDIE